MAVIILPERDTGENVSTNEIVERVLEAAPAATCRLARGERMEPFSAPLRGVEVDDAAALAYLATLDTATGRERKG